MRGRALSPGLALILALALVCAANAQTPYIAVYFDPGFTATTKVCPGPGLDVWYVAAVNFNSLITGAEFAISYPAAVTWLADTNTPPVKIGSTPSGISMGYPIPVNGFSPVELCRVQVQWNCEECDSSSIDAPITVIAHPHTTFLGWTDESYTEQPASGWTSFICPFASPAEPTTWGRVKALFGE